MELIKPKIISNYENHHDRKDSYLDFPVLETAYRSVSYGNQEPTHIYMCEENFIRYLKFLPDKDLIQIILYNNPIKFHNALVELSKFNNLENGEIAIINNELKDVDRFNCLLRVKVKQPSKNYIVIPLESIKLAQILEIIPLKMETEEYSGLNGYSFYLNNYNSEMQKYMLVRDCNLV